MKHYVMGFIFNRTRNKVLLVKKKRPEWQVNKWNAIGGKIDDDDTDANPLSAMYRETNEEIGYPYDWEHCVTFVCPGGTVFVFRAFCETICFIQKEDELLQVWDLDILPANIDADLKWLIAVCLAKLDFPIFASQKTLLGE